MRLHQTEVSPIYFQEGAPLTQAFGGKNKNTNHHSKCTCYFPSGVRNWIASESRENAADGLGLELVSPHAVGREEETWRGELACVRDGGLCWPINGPWRSAPRQMADAARRSSCAGCPCGFLSILGSSGSSRLADTLLPLGLRGARGRFRGSEACGNCFLWCRRGQLLTKDHSESSQRHQEARRGPREAPGTVPAHIIFIDPQWGRGRGHRWLGDSWLRCPQAGDLGVFQTGWGRVGSLLLGEGGREGRPTRSREEKSQMLYHCRGACVSQATAHPVTFELSQKGEGCVQQAGGG